MSVVSENLSVTSKEVAFHFADSILGSHSLFSPNFAMLAIVSASRLTLRDIRSGQVLHIYSCIDKIERVAFSPDSQFILCAMLSRNAVQIFSVADGEWRCRLNEGVAGMVNAIWAPNSRHVLTESDFGIQLNIWSLLDSTTHVIASPKQPPASAGVFWRRRWIGLRGWWQFSGDGRLVESDVVLPFPLRFSVSSTFSPPTVLPPTPPLPPLPPPPSPPSPFPKQPTPSNSAKTTHLCWAPPCATSASVGGIWPWCIAWRAKTTSVSRRVDGV